MLIGSVTVTQHEQPILTSQVNSSFWLPVIGNGNDHVFWKNSWQDQFIPG